MRRPDVCRHADAATGREGGATTTECAIVLVLIAAGAVAAVAVFGGDIEAAWQPLSSAF